MWLSNSIQPNHSTRQYCLVLMHEIHRLKIIFCHRCLRDRRTFIRRYKADFPPGSYASMWCVIVRLSLRKKKEKTKKRKQKEIGVITVLGYLRFRNTRSLEGGSLVKSSTSFEFIEWWGILKWILCFKNGVIRIEHRSLERKTDTQINILKMIRMCDERRGVFSFLCFLSVELVTYYGT